MGRFVTLYYKTILKNEKITSGTFDKKALHLIKKGCPQRSKTCL